MTNPLTARLIACAFGEAALLHVEDLLFADLLTLASCWHGVAVAAHGDRRIGVRAAVGVDQQRVALGVVLAALEVLRDVDQAAVGGAALCRR